MSKISHRKPSQVTEEYFNSITGTWNQSNSQAGLSAGRVGQGLVARKGMEVMANKRRSAVNIVAERGLVFEPGKSSEGKVGSF